MFPGVVLWLTRRRPNRRDATFFMSQQSRLAVLGLWPRLGQ